MVWVTCNTPLFASSIEAATRRDRRLCLCRGAMFNFVQFCQPVQRWMIDRDCDKLLHLIETSMLVTFLARPRSKGDSTNTNNFGNVFYLSNDQFEARFCNHWHSRVVRMVDCAKNHWHPELKRPPARNWLRNGPVYEQIRANLKQVSERVIRMISIVQ